HDGHLGRIVDQIAASKPSIVYAAVEAKRGAIFRSDDRGQTWKEMNTSANASVRPFYFGMLVVDPNNPDRLYKPAINLIASDDGGPAITPIGGGGHSDPHALSGGPAPPRHLIAAH